MQRTTANVAIALFLGLGLTLACLWVLVGGASTVQAQGPDGYDVYYVAPSCVGVPVPCYTTVQDAVDAVDAPDDVVKVAAGTYTDVDVRPRNDITNIGLVTQVVYISRGVTIQGGYTTTDWTSPAPEANPTILDAQGQGRVFYVTGDISPTIEGLCITGGDSDSGGGVYIYQATAIVSNNLVFSNAAAYEGGGFGLYSSASTLSDNTVISNSAGYGGGLYFYGSDATLERNTVVSNSAESCGGGLHLEYSSALLTGNSIFSNTVQWYGGGVCLSFSPAELEDNTLTGNSAYAGGGLLLDSSGATLINNIVSANSAEGGGGLYLSFSAATLNANTLTANSAERFGGGLYLYFSDVTLSNNLLVDNQADNQGGGLYVRASSPQLAHNTIAHNYGGDGGGVYVVEDATVYSDVALTDTILVSHTVGITVAAGNTATLEATLWGSGDWANGADWGGAGTIFVGAHNYWGDPAFIDPDAGDYHIGPDSAAIDAGVDAGVSDDIDGDPRPVGGGYDIGADERRDSEILSVYLPLVLKQ